nr:phospholipase-like protein [Tanacetum cinerariifolium]
MASNTDQIENLEVALGQFQDGIAEMKIVFADKFQHLEDIVMKLSDAVLYGKGVDNYKQAGRSMFYSNLTKLEFPTYRGDEDPTEWFTKFDQFYKYQGTMTYDCKVTIRSKLKMIPNIKERISSSKKRLDLLKKLPDLNKSVDSDILFDIAGRTLLLGRAEFWLVTGFACGKVVFPKYLDDGIPPFVRRLFLDKLKKLEKNNVALEEVAKCKVTYPSDKSDKDSMMIGHLGELVLDKAAKGKAAQPSDKGDKVSVTNRDLGSRGKKVIPTFMLRLVNDLAAWDDFPWSEYYWEEFHNKMDVVPQMERKEVVRL